MKWKTFHPFSWIKRLYNWTLALAGHPKAIYWLAGLSFAESSFFPIPPDVLLLPLCLARRERALSIALVCTLASVIGGAFGYALGFFAFETVGQVILDFYGMSTNYTEFQSWYEQQGSLVVLIAGFTPIPYKVITICTGVLGYPFGLFLLFSIISRGTRFGIEALLVRRFGEPALAIIDRHFNKLTILAAILFIGGFLALKWIF